MNGKYGSLFNWLSLCVLGGFLIMAVTATKISPHDPNVQDLLMRFKPPFWLSGSEDGYWLGTDNMGRDLLSRIIYGSQVSILVGVAAVVISGVLGTIIGLLSGFYSALDHLMMRIADIQLAFPTILLALAIVAVIGGGLNNLIIVLGITGWVPYARVIRSEVLSIRSSDFVVAAQTIGVSDFRLLFRHILPNIFSPVITIATFQVASAIIAESSLSFLGLGVPVSVPSWGNMLNQGQLYMESAWWISVFPGLSIMLIVLAINILGDIWRDKLNPKAKGR
ncbi:ABC transporter permease [Paenibacillus sp. MAH-36]|uniref:ABC transporter permease n=2 Tax=Paenibacillus TaxID=44249 RepID=A0ABU3RBT6_9BACL|nr:ABC transporter permease [Paenibacillus sp. PFR10]MDU0201716.1 ABC transporter permease [Paenibacillus sp. PFR10]